MCYIINVLFLSTQLLQCFSQSSDNEFCSSDIYCRGELLDDVQMQRLYPDSKTFVDKKLLRSEEEILEAYQELKLQNNGEVPTGDVLSQFIDENFADDPLVEWVPPDFVENPSVVDFIHDVKYREWVIEINQVWKQLARRMDEDVKTNPDRHSSIYLPNGFFIAGGRFTELYYWDSFWIIRGALLCDMTDTAKGIIENFIYLVRRYGYVPNGNRIYYLLRSQPPLLIFMAKTYYEYMKDFDFIKENIEHLETEFNFWMINRTIEVKKTGNTYIMAQYNPSTEEPRPESYYEDKTLAKTLPSEEKKKMIYKHIRGAAESGWDFSSKHFDDDGENTGGLIKTNPENFIYVELNSILQANACFLGKMYELLGDLDKSKYYYDIGHRFQMGINALLWNQEEQIWLDYDLTTESSRNYFYPSNLVPLWTGSYEKRLHVYYSKCVFEHLVKHDIIDENGNTKLICIPTSTVNTTQQWDYPNCWPPLQAMVIQGLGKSRYEPARRAALNLAKSWIHTNYKGFVKTGTMFEKYSALEEGTTGDGGEYKPQTGFGWTNGYIIELFWKWGSIFTSVSED